MKILKKFRNFIIDIVLSAWFLLFVFNCVLLAKYALTDNPHHNEVLITISDVFNIHWIFNYLIWSNIPILFFPKTRRPLLHGLGFIANIVSILTILVSYVCKSLGFLMDYIGEKSDDLSEYCNKIKSKDNRNYFKTTKQALNNL